MKTVLMAPVALIALLSGAVNSSEDAATAASPEEAIASACLPARTLDLDAGRRYDAVILRHARRRLLNPRLVKAVIAAESQFTPTAVSRCGARGLMQVMPATAREIGVRACDLSDPETNISAGTEYLSRLFRAAGRRSGGTDAQRARRLRRVIAAYHSGPAALDDTFWSEPTQRYVRTVLSCYESPVSALGTQTAAAPPAGRGERREGL